MGRVKKELIDKYKREALLCRGSVDYDRLFSDLIDEVREDTMNKAILVDLYVKFEGQNEYRKTVIDKEKTIKSLDDE